MRRDVTSLFQSYRECARHIRNTYFSTRETKDWNIVDSFQQIETVLFKQMVLHRLENPYSAHLDTVVEKNRIQIVPSSLSMPVMIGREKGRTGYWDHPITELEPKSATIAFQKYFDWDEFDLIDYRYFYGLVLESPYHPEIVGHYVLIETIHGKVEYTGDQPAQP